MNKLLPFGPTLTETGANFSIPSFSAKSVALQLFSSGVKEPFKIVPMNRTAAVFHVFVEGLQPPFEYSYLIDGKEIIDPFSKETSQGSDWLDRRISFRSACYSAGFDWEGVPKPAIPLDQLIIYEMHVRGFTADQSSHTGHRGKFSAIIEKIPYLKKLGVNAIELMPIYVFNESEYKPASDKPFRYCNFWGYSSIHFMAPMGRYGSDPLFTLKEFKELVKALHKEKMEVILDVVYNHTAEGNENGPVYNFKTLDNDSYYLMSPDGHYLNYSGCGNTFASNRYLGAHLILESLRYWATECQVDGFRFDLASILTRGDNGSVLSPAPLIELVTSDPLLHGVKLIAEPWDAGGLYQLGAFPAWGFAAEWNGRYRDNVRKFIKGTDGVASDFATAFCGSTDLYFSLGRPTCSVNFITAHDGFTLRDLVSYNEKHNEDNGEENRDGANDNESYNCGFEGATDAPEVLQLRCKQMKNFFVALLLSQGIPMILMGDEYGHTKRGNNNTWCIDDERNWFSWDEAERNKALVQFVSNLIDFRKKHPLLHMPRYLAKTEITWHGLIPNKPDWGAKSRFVACSLHEESSNDEIYIAFNSFAQPVEVTLPQPRWSGRWQKIIDTAAAAPDDFLTSATPYTLHEEKFLLPAYTTIVLEGSHYV